jgi:hypothetical protein
MGASSATALAALKIARRVAFERLVRPKARRRDDVPCSPAAITTEWLTAVLCEKVHGAVVTQVEIKPASAGTHERHRLVLAYNETGRRAGLPSSLFTKSLPSVVTRMIGGFNGTARAEGRFYMQLRPQLKIEAPVGYHAAFDPKTFASILLLEDLVAAKAATFCNHKTYVTRAMAEEMMDLLARLHVRFYGDCALATRYGWVAPYARWFTIGAKKMDLEQPARHSMRPRMSSRKACWHGEGRCGPRRSAHLRCTKAGLKDCFTRMSILATGIGRAADRWAFATGSVCREGTGRAMLPMP